MLSEKFDSSHDWNFTSPFFILTIFKLLKTKAWSRTTSADCSEAPLSKVFNLKNRLKRLKNLLMQFQKSLSTPLPLSHPTLVSWQCTTTMDITVSSTRPANDPPKSPMHEFDRFRFVEFYLLGINSVIV